MKLAVVADTGGLLRALASDERGRPTWPHFAAVLTQASSVVVPPLILAEVDYFLRDHRAASGKLIAEILDPGTTYELEPILPEDLARAIELDVKFADLEIGLVDGTVAAVAERRGIHRILTIDRGHFGTIRIGPKYKQALTLVP